MDRPRELPDDLAACQQQILEAHRALDEQRCAFEEQRRAFDEQRRVLDEVDASYHELLEENQALKAELLLLRRWAFGQRRERITEADGQRHLFDLAGESSPSDEASPPEEEPQEAAPTPSSARRRRRMQRQLNLEHLPQRRIEHVVTDEEQVCQTCGCPKTRIGEDESRMLHYVPAQLEVEVHVLPKYACPCCKDGVTSPAPPVRPLPRSIAGPGLIGFLVVSKFGDHLPLYRLEDILTRHGLFLPRSTLCDWVQGAAELLRPLYELQKMLVLHSPLLWTDDTPVRVLDAQAKGGSRLGRFWAYIGNADFPYSVYDFTMNRSRAGPAEFLKDYVGYLHADAYGGYDGIYLQSDGRITEVACGSHLRRKFYNARPHAPRPCAQMLDWFRQLYDVEDRARDWSDDERLALRQQDALPVLDRMKAYLDEQALSALPKSSLGQAVTYALNQWTAFRRYTEDGRLTIDNNVSERTLRPQAIGRKNWLFLGHENAGSRAAVLYTILAGAKRHHLEPWVYVTNVLLRLAGQATPDLESLLPDRWAATHPGQILTHRLEESRDKRARQKAKRALRRRPH